VSFLFSGGVFRGVYQLGVLNGLNELGLKPDVIAGASVGSITAAMAAKTFSIQPLLSPANAPERRGSIARLAAVFLAMDHLILTDRFADFIRDLTLRAAGTRFSVRHADCFFRKYDYPGFLEFDRNARNVLAGIERLFYVNPYQVNRLVKAFRDGDRKAALNGLLESIEHWLERMQVGNEILGAEPLSELIDTYVTSLISTANSLGPTFDDLRETSGIQLLATATNLTEGRLEIIGEQPVSAPDGPALLKEGLLTSSAFPGVFRPRWSWELYPKGRSRCQYIDGGVMDNLPIDAVAQFLTRAAHKEIKLINPTPVQPHLIVAASLEVNARDSTPFERIALQNSWPALFRRTRELGYNLKLDSYARAESRLRQIARLYPGEPREIEPIDLEVVAVKPEWLCNTFGFHPMLGFRRDRQKRSIAHGCASTLLRFAGVDAKCLKGWGIEENRVPRVKDWRAAFNAEGGRLTSDDSNDSRCWLRPDPDLKLRCPFSSSELRKAEPALPEETIKELSGIHRECRTLEAQLKRL
jgi:predicted acylesterase/phospholipase RssA